MQLWTHWMIAKNVEDKSFMPFRRQLELVTHGSLKFYGSIKELRVEKSFGSQEFQIWDAGELLKVYIWNFRWGQQQSFKYVFT
ncbi:hypothetical protein BVC80_209g334 [Macleaya cordata]|uniref:Uncharacterized protein n=1 Tax=Macleaya cordata TaxID=56857 RepID=A0A200QDM9_MACCD|nr:hypothetical protein BVC80_209g334 [Macleaya cordata]